MNRRGKDQLHLNDINAEIENRIKEIESSDYVFPVRLKKKDWFGFLLVMIICAAALVGLIVFCASA